MYIAFLALLVIWTIVEDIIGDLDSKEPNNIDVTEKAGNKGLIIDTIFSNRTT